MQRQLITDCVFSELFSSFRRQEDGGKTEYLNYHGREIATSVVVTRFDGPKAREVFVVEPTKLVLAAVHGEMLTLDNDRLYFELVEQSDQTVCIYVRYNVILGSRLLAIVPAKSVRQTRSDAGTKKPKVAALYAKKRKAKKKADAAKPKVKRSRWVY